MKDLEEIRNEFEQELVNNGYKFFKDMWEGSLRGIQKRFKDEKGTKYFITGYHYNHGESFPDRGLESRDTYTFGTKLRLDKDGKDICVNINFSGDFLPNPYREVTTLKDVEDFFEQTFLSLGADYYEKDLVD